MQSLVLVLGVWVGTELLSGIDKGVASWKRRRKRKGRGSKVDEDGRKIAVVSTAAMPWMTGTAVNPTLRAAFLAELTNNEVTLVIPWLAPSDQKLVFPNDLCFQKPSEQEQCIREWVRKRTGINPPFQVAFYSGRYDRLLLGIFPVGNPMDSVARMHTDVVIMEEPEHISWFHHGRQWMHSFEHVVGVMHTNQVELGRRNAGILGPVMAAAAFMLTFMLCGMHCHKVIKLSDTLQILPRQVTCFVHGAAPMFLEEGRRKAQRGQQEGGVFTKGAYALGKVVWGKGWEELLSLLHYCKMTDSTCPATAIDCYGDGEARRTIEERANRQGLPMQFHEKCDHLDSRLQDYKVFVNASTSDVVATTSIEALAMGKWLICAHHPCNAFASHFANTLVYHDPDEFCQHLEYALENDPHPLDADTLRQLGWEAATERFLAAAEIDAQKWPSLPAEVASSLLWRVYRTFTGIEAVRLLVCAGANTRDTPVRVTDYDPAKMTARSAGHNFWRVFYRVLPNTITVGGPGWWFAGGQSRKLTTDMVQEHRLLADS